MITVSKPTEREMSLTTTVRVLVFTLLYVSVVLGQNGWSVIYSSQSICVLKGSTVDLSCSYTYPSGTVTSAYWIITFDVNLQTDSNYSGRVTYRNYTSNHDNNNHTLTITDLRETDSAEYKFRFITDQPRGQWIGQPGVTLSFPASPVEQYILIPVLVGITVAVLVLMVLCLSGFIWFRKKPPKTISDTRDQSDSGQGNSNPTYENISSVGKTSENNDQQDDFQYASVNFNRAKTKNVPLYDNVQPPEQDEEVQYAAVKFNPPSAATKPTGVAEEESSVLYCTVMNKSR
ncbi:hypothetical protein DPEC_G00171100 [Dallia pectoralis]|uniref:Uncharacterized protein n=1 Tax=Dallia pectoralis TaxID=75939 RepID=A0ACC2GDL4_DALPE|nr:hypothetical protein DPEC_G00171100 [Dallia pectoralis]